MTKTIFLLTITFLLCCPIFAQNTAQIEWMDFNQLTENWKNYPKKTLVFFYEDHCVYCKKMERTAFKNPGIIKKLNEDFYAVKMDVHTTDTIIIEGQKFTNPRADRSRTAIHQLAYLFMHRAGYPDSFPVTVLLDKNFKVINRSYTYLSPQAMKEFIDP